MRLAESLLFFNMTNDYFSESSTLFPAKRKRVLLLFSSKKNFFHRQIKPIYGILHVFFNSSS